MATSSFVPPSLAPTIAREHRRSLWPSLTPVWTPSTQMLDVVHLGEIPPHEALTLLLPLLAEVSDRRGRKPRLGAEDLLQCGHEVPTGEAVEVEKGQHFGNLR